VFVGTRLAGVEARVSEEPATIQVDDCRGGKVVLEPGDKTASDASWESHGSLDL
jgi:hypothetical protein